MRFKVFLMLVLLVTTTLLVRGVDLSFAKEATPPTPAPLAVAQSLETTYLLNNGGSGGDTTTLYPDGTVVTAMGSSGHWVELAPNRRLIVFPPGTASGSVWVGTYVTPTTVHGFVWFQDIPGLYGTWDSNVVQPPQGMIYIPAGEFQMGCDQSNPHETCIVNELPLHTVYLSAYHIDAQEVTNDQYVVFLNARDSNECDGYECIDLDDPDTHIIYQDGQYVVEPNYGDHPVNEVSWGGADLFCTESGKRLPTEAEWEKAARGGRDTRMLPWGNMPAECPLANYGFCVSNTTPVGTYPAGASPYGALDMAGNLFEWVSDWYDVAYYAVSPYADPQGPPTGTKAVMRGGSWSNPWAIIRVAFRYHGYPPDTYTTVGFRCAASVD